MSADTFQLFDHTGARKYLTGDERGAFLKAAESGDRSVRTFCMVLAFTGCRISEGLALTADRVDLAGNVIIFESLKKRRKGLYRAVPVPNNVVMPWTSFTASGKFRKAAAAVRASSCGRGAERRHGAV